MSDTPPGNRYDVLTIGRVGVDIYPLQDGVGLEDVETFGKYLGGSATNVAIAAARHGHSTAVITRTGNDPFGRYVRRELERLGVSSRFVSTADRLNTPVTFCEIFPPDDFPLYFYRDPIAPDLTISPSTLDLDAISRARVYWSTVTGLSVEPSRAAHHTAWEARDRVANTVLDLDWRPMFWRGEREATTEIGRALEHVTVAVGNLEECRVAVGETEADRAADALLERGVELAVVKRGPLGVLAKTRDERVEVEPYLVKVVNGLGAGDGFGGALCHGLLEGWSLERTVRFANVAGAIVAGRRECSTAMPTTDEVDLILEGIARMVLLSEPDFDRLRTLRAEQPALIGELLRGRRRRPLLEGDRRLFLVAADHPARGALAVADRASAMADRYDLLQRLVVALARPGVDGVLGTPDIIEDLAVLGALDGKVVAGSMNRGGLRGAVFEMDDRYTGYDVTTMQRDGIDFAKLLIRINLDDAATAETLHATAQAVTDAAEAHLPIMLEPFMSTWVDGAIRNDLSTEAVIKSVAVASGLGASSAFSWLKLPVVPDMEAVMAATTLPTLLLGGDPTGSVDAVLATWAAALALPGVRGLVAGRSLLYPADDDVAKVVDLAASLVHADTSAPARQIAG